MLVRRSRLGKRVVLTLPKLRDAGCGSWEGKLIVFVTLGFSRNHSILAGAKSAKGGIESIWLGSEARYRNNNEYIGYLRSKGRTQS